MWLLCKHEGLQWELQALPAKEKVRPWRLVLSHNWTKNYFKAVSPFSLLLLHKTGLYFFTFGKKYASDLQLREPSCSREHIFRTDLWAPEGCLKKDLSGFRCSIFFFFWITLYLIEIVEVFSMGILRTDWALPWNLFSNAYFMISIFKPQNLYGKKYILYLCGLFNKLEVDKLKHLPPHLIRNTLKNDTWDIWKWHRTTTKLLKEKKMSSLNMDFLMRTF